MTRLSGLDILVHSRSPRAPFRDEEAGDQVVHPELTHFFGEPRRAGKHQRVKLEKSAAEAPRNAWRKAGCPADEQIQDEMAGGVLRKAGSPYSTIPVITRGEPP
jgi:hypothetical protein